MEPSERGLWTGTNRSCVPRTRQEGHQPLSPSTDQTRLEPRGREAGDESASWNGAGWNPRGRGSRDAPAQGPSCAWGLPLWVPQPLQPRRTLGLHLGRSRGWASPPTGRAGSLPQAHVDRLGHWPWEGG